MRIKFLYHEVGSKWGCLPIFSLLKYCQWSLDTFPVVASWSWAWQKSDFQVSNLVSVDTFSVAGRPVGRVSLLIIKLTQLQLQTGNELGKINHFGLGVYNDHYNHQLSLLSLISYVSLSTLIAFDPLRGNSRSWKFVGSGYHWLSPFLSLFFFHSLFLRSLLLTHFEDTP